MLSHEQFTTTAEVPTRTDWDFWYCPACWKLLMHVRGRQLQPHEFQCIGCLTFLIPMSGMTFEVVDAAYRLGGGMAITVLVQGYHRNPDRGR